MIRDTFSWTSFKVQFKSRACRRNSFSRRARGLEWSVWVGLPRRTGMATAALVYRWWLGVIPPPGRARFSNEEPGAAVFDSVEQLLGDERVAVVDLAAPHVPAIRVPLVEALCRSGKPVLIQKPLGFTYGEAVRYVEMMEAAGLTVMVNQNSCFAGGVLDEAARGVLLEGRIGAPFLGRTYNAVCFDMGGHPWFGKGDRWWTTDVSVHEIALLHLFFGPPESVMAITGRDPEQPGVVKDGFGHALLRYASGAAATVYSTGTYYGPMSVPYALEIQGPKGILSLQPGLRCVWSLRENKGDSDLQVCHRKVPVSHGWFPDGFGIAMAHFLACLGSRQTPICSVQDNLYVMAVVEAMYRSAQENRTVFLEEIMGARYGAGYGPGALHGWMDWPRPAKIPEAKIWGDYSWERE